MNNIKQTTIFLLSALVLIIGTTSAVNYFFPKKDLPEKENLSKSEFVQTVSSEASDKVLAMETDKTVSKNFVKAQTEGCTTYVVHQNNCAAYCDAGEQFVIGGCVSDFIDMDELPIVSSEPVVSYEADPDDARPGWACSYEVRRDGTYGTTAWYGGYCMQSYVMCCTGDGEVALPQTYFCQGLLPIDAVECLGDSYDLTSEIPWLGVGDSASDCTAGRKCEYYVPPYECTGPDYANATMCPNDDEGLTYNMTNVLMNVCGDGRKCEMVCDEGFTLDGGTCVQDPTCIGNIPNSTLCDNDDVGLTEDMPKVLVGACSAVKCEVTCNPGYVMDAGVCVTAPETCYSHDHQSCSDGDIYWFDSCNYKEDMVEPACDWCGCTWDYCDTCSCPDDECSPGDRGGGCGFPVRNTICICESHPCGSVVCQWGCP